MATKQANWIVVAESRFPWEREALDFVRERFPTHEPYRAWSNFEFIADDGSINEVDLLAFTPQGFFLVEIKSRPGRVLGDAGTWTWETDGRFATVDNPVFAANLKAKKLRALLERQKATNKKERLPFLEALVFCSAPELRLELQGAAKSHVCLRDRDVSPDGPARAGIVAALKRREGSGLESTAKGVFDRPMAKAVHAAMEQAGIRPSQRSRRVGDFILEKPLAEGPGYQDWLARHAQIEESKRRIRLYLVRLGGTEEERQRIDRAAHREYRILEALGHPGVLKAQTCTEHEMGPALLFEHDPNSVRLDHYLLLRKDDLDVAEQIDLVRQLAEVVRYAHEKKVVHRALCPQSVLVSSVNGRPRIKVFNWQVGYRQGPTSTAVSHVISATSHVEQMVEDAGRAYLAPEALSDDNTGEHLDVFSLGTIAYHIFSGQTPAADELELHEKLRGKNGLQISSVLNGAGEWLQYLVQSATHPIVDQRTDSVTEFLGALDEVERELTTPEPDYVDDPTQAQIGERIEGGYEVLRRLGRGATSIAFLVQRDDQDFVLKVAAELEFNDRVREEAEVLQKLRHAHVVEFVTALELGGRTGFLMRPVFADRAKKTIETLGQRLRKEGRLHVDLLQRFGEDLLDVVNHLEEQGIPHRDIKPDNIAVGMVGRGSKLHLVLFDFSLSRTPPENLRAGTTGYLDPLLPLRKPPPRWDLYAERYAAAATLYELATGSMPKWGDGVTLPSQLRPDTEVTLDSEAFEPGLREPLTEFFAKAFRRDVEKRFHNAEEMLAAWREAFVGIDDSAPLSDHADESDLRELLDDATYDTQLVELGLGTRAANALDRANLLTVEDLLTIPLRRLLRQRGVGNKTRREISAAVKILRERLGTPDRSASPQVNVDASDAGDGDVDALGVDLLFERMRKVGSRDGDTTQATLRLLLGIDPGLPDSWPSQSDIARLVDVTRARVGQIVGKAADRWAKDAALTRLRADLAEMIAGQGGVMSADELADALLVARGSSYDDERREQYSRAVVRATAEVERLEPSPRFVVRRDDHVVLLVVDSERGHFARRLGEVADQVAAEDPLLPSAAVLNRLHQIQAPADLPIPDARLLRIAAIASRTAAVSSRLELYPREMSAARALKLSKGALLGVRSLAVEEVRARVSSRYPEASPLPDRPPLDDLLREAGFEWKWDPEGRGGVGCYVSEYRDQFSVTSGSQEPSRAATSVEQSIVPGEITPEEADARQFEERLVRSLKEGSFLSLLINGRHYERARDELCRRFPLEYVDFEELFLDALKSVVDSAGAKWDLVLKTDAHPRSGDWDKLLILANRCMPAVEQRLLSATKPILLAYPGLLARYEQMELLSRLSQKAGRRDGIPGLWLLVPGENQALIDGKPVPLIGPGQKARIPISWLKNLHRANGNGVKHA